METVIANNQELKGVIDEGHNAFSCCNDQSYKYTGDDINIIGQRLVEALPADEEVAYCYLEQGDRKYDLKASFDSRVKLLTRQKEAGLIVSSKKIVGIYHANTNHWISYVVVKDPSTTTQNSKSGVHVRFKDSLGEDDPLGAGRSYLKDFKKELTRALQIYYDIKSVETMGKGVEQIQDYEPNGNNVSCGLFALRNMEILARMSIADLIAKKEQKFHSFGSEPMAYAQQLKLQRLLLGNSFVQSCIEKNPNREATAEQTGKYVVDVVGMPASLQHLWWDGSVWLAPTEDRLRQSVLENNQQSIASSEGFGSDDGAEFEELKTGLFAAVRSLDVDKLNKIISAHKSNADFLKRLINSRVDGINLLGIVLLRPKDKSFDKARDKARNKDWKAVAKLIIDQHLFKVNEYVVKGFHQNVLALTSSSDNNASQLAGMNAFHVSILRGWEWLYNLLLARNKALKETTFEKSIEVASRHDLYVNFCHPIAHPSYHMFSPLKLRETLDKRGFERNYPWMEKLGDNSWNSSYPSDWSDSSGDSDDSDYPASRAYVYKQWIRDLVGKGSARKADDADDAINPQGNDLKLQTPKMRSFEQNELEILLTKLNLESVEKQNFSEVQLELAEKMAIAHYHGMPFMKGQYSSAQQFETAKEIVRLCNKSSGPAEEKESFLISRTLASSCLIENMRTFLKMPELQAEVKRVDEALNIILGEMRLSDNGRFQHLLSLFVNASTIDNDETNKHHRNFWSSITSFCRGRPALAKHLEGVVQYRYPFLSTSKAPDHPAKYGSGQHLEGGRGELPVDPQYNGPRRPKNRPAGRPKHRLAGFLYVIRQDYPSYSEGYGSVYQDLSHHHMNKNMRCINDASETVRLSFVMRPQFEVTYLRPVGNHDIVAAIPILYPNLSKKYNAKYQGQVLRCSIDFYEKRQKDQSVEKIRAGMSNTVAQLAYRQAKFSEMGEGNALVYTSPLNELKRVPEYNLLKSTAKAESSPQQSALQSDVTGPGKLYNKKLATPRAHNQLPFSVVLSPSAESQEAVRKELPVPVKLFPPLVSVGLFANSNGLLRNANATHAAEDKDEIDGLTAAADRLKLSDREVSAQKKG